MGVVILTRRTVILAKLWRRDLFGGKYTPIENALSGIPKEDRGDAKDEVDRMHKDGLIQKHKGSDCISINPSAKDKVRELLKDDDDFPDYIL